MSRGIALTCLIAMAATAAGQEYVLRDGTVLTADLAERRDGALVVHLTGPAEEGAAERWYPLTDVVRLNWPEPPELAAARRALENAEPGAVPSRLAPVVAQFAPFAHVPGSWWGEAAWLRARALVDLGRSGEAVPLVQALLAHPDPGPLAPAARLLFVEIDLTAGRTEVAAAMLANVRGAPDLTLEQRAQICLLAGEMELRRGRYEAAVETFLRVPVFHGRVWALRPAALLGSGRAYRKLGQAARAERAWRDLLRGWPDHPLTTAARRELASAGLEILP